ncbi:MAG: T9SS type A sorting domain-containing protein [Brumimicrobium sp.]|nr:T9SS type A sorting domain-containing protein [Brumimicrobium sp.]MCO5269602.1 M43 family zinc metalloprotease [Brumimicrobium sp.]
MKYLIYILLAFPLFVGAQQDNWCGTSELTNDLWATHPELKEAFYEQMAQFRNSNGVFDKDGEEPDTIIFTIPVVFHVLHEYGVENISDAQIHRQIDILNRDYAKLNADTASVIPEFQSIIGKAYIRFKLATQDPVGNPTTGIVRHFTHESNIGDAYSKLDQWPRSRYLNIWTVKKIYSGAAGYSQYPTNVEGAAGFMDGVVVLHNYVADNGTSNPYSSRAVTHEVGHYLGLPHVWGDNNDPMQACGDDGIEDTPRTRGYDFCPLNQSYPSGYPPHSGKTYPDNAMICNDTVVENFQNYMDYSYCSHMFTQLQVKYMRTSLKSNTSGRMTMVSEANLANSIPDGVVADPVADFFTNSKEIVSCVGSSVKFNNYSWGITTSSPTYTWTFEDADVTTSNDVNPTVSFTSPGWKTVTLKVEDHGKSNTITKESFIWIAPNWPVFNGLVNIDFNTPSQQYAGIALNPQNYDYAWEVLPNVGTNGSGAIFLDMSNPYTNPLPLSPESFFKVRRGGSKVSFVTQPMDLSLVSNGTLSFDYACATDATSLTEMTEELWVYSSIDCGNSWQLRNKILPKNLVNNGTGWESFKPDANSTWTNASFSVATLNKSHVMFKFEYLASDQSNNISIDNINVSGVLATDAEDLNSQISVYPNPSNASTGWNINYDATQWGGANVQLYDIAGRVISTSELPMGQSMMNLAVNNKAAKGVYILKIRQNDKLIQKKLILE